ncbi:MAG: hypothetical protein JO060_09690 [Candidatus Eremiobacteraeota bacterium]|nr:hypothetical protein [Candidatus Eremiobacteraeota bacterium]MBV9646396.1 hypothetical protein [Candidatus Eremiobacteraeota bacterium]
MGEYSLPRVIAIGSLITLTATAQATAQPGRMSRPGVVPLVAQHNGWVPLSRVSVAPSGFQACPCERVYLADSYPPETVYAFPQAGQGQSSCGQITKKLFEPWGLAVKQKQDGTCAKRAPAYMLYVSQFYGKIYRFNENGNPLAGTLAGAGRGPAGLAFDRGGNLYVTDEIPSGCCPSLPPGSFSSYAGGAGAPMYHRDTNFSATYYIGADNGNPANLFIDGLNTSGAFQVDECPIAPLVNACATLVAPVPAWGSTPGGVAVDATQNLYVNDPGLSRLCKYPPPYNAVPTCVNYSGGTPDLGTVPPLTIALNDVDTMFWGGDNAPTIQGAAEFTPAGVWLDYIAAPPSQNFYSYGIATAPRSPF